MAKQTINIGAVANDGTGDFLRDAYDKCNDNFDELYTALTTDRAVADGGTGASTPAGARTNLELEIGTHVQAHSANLDEYAAVNPTSAGLALLDDADASAQLTTLGVSTFIKTLLDDTTAGAALTTLGVSAFAQTLLDDADASTAQTTLGISTFAKTILDDADAAAVRTTIGAGTGTGDLVSTNNLSDVANAVTAGANIRPVESLIIAVGDETTAITTGTAKVTFRMPYAFTLTAVRASVVTAPTGSTIIIDINEAGTTILSTKLSIDASEKTSTTAASAAVISDASLADDAEMTIDFDQVGSSVAGAGVKVALIGHRT